jgi:hypothetical protein
VHKAPLAVVRGVVAVKAVCERLLLRVHFELGNEQGVFDGDVPGGERLGHRWHEVQEPDSFGDVCGVLPRFRRYALDGVPGPFAVEQGAKPLRLLKRMHIGPKNVLDDLRFERLLVAEIGDACGYFRQTRSLRGAIAPCPRNDFEMSIHSPREER